MALEHGDRYPFMEYDWYVVDGIQEDAKRHRHRTKMSDKAVEWHIEVGYFKSAEKIPGSGVERKYQVYGHFTPGTGPHVGSTKHVITEEQQYAEAAISRQQMDKAAKEFFAMLNGEDDPEEPPAATS